RDYLEEMPDLKAGIGFDTRDVVASGRPQEDHPLRKVEIVVGAFDPQLTRSLLEECAGCAEAPEAVSYGGEVYYRWGGAGLAPPNLRARFEPPLFVYLGRGGRLLLTDPNAVQTYDSRDMEAIIDAIIGISVS